MIKMLLPVNFCFSPKSLIIHNKAYYKADKQSYQLWVNISSDWMHPLAYPTMHCQMEQLITTKGH